jgi:hypothetical protein
VVSSTTIWRLAQRFWTTGAVNDRPISGRHLTPIEERYIRITAGRDRFLLVTRIVDRVQRTTVIRISVQTVRNKLKAPHTIKLPPPKWLTGITQASAKHSQGRLQTRMRSSASFSVNRDSCEKSTVIQFRRMCWLGEWNAIPQYKIQIIIRGMQKRCRATITVNGAWTRY